MFLTNTFCSCSAWLHAPRGKLQKVSLTKNQHTHTFLLVKLRCGKQDKEQHGKAIRHWRDSFLGSSELGVRSMWSLGGRWGEAKREGEPLTLSLDYREWEGPKTEEGVGKQHREEWTDGNLRWKRYLWCWHELRMKGHHQGDWVEINGREVEARWACWS